jgi:hypothetical protein
VESGYPGETGCSIVVNGVRGTSGGGVDDEEADLAGMTLFLRNSDYLPPQSLCLLPSVSSETVRSLFNR